MQTVIEWNLAVNVKVPVNTVLLSFDDSGLVLCRTNGKGNWWINEGYVIDHNWEPVIWAIAPSFPVIPAV